jgi:L-amino acid N-acyltransferase YncA
MEYRIRLAQNEDSKSIAEIFNHFVLNTFSAYPSLPVDESIFSRMKAMAGKLPIYVAENSNGAVVGFAGLRPLHFADTLSRSAEATIFILPEHICHGLGGQLLETMEEDAKALGVDTIIGGASSHNQPSLDFQRKHGFSECGRFQRVGRKFDKDFDIIWMQKFI